MKVILSVYPIREPLTGIGRYAWELAAGLERHSRVSDIRYFDLGRWVSDPHKLLVSGSGSRLRKALTGSVIAVSIYEKISPLLLGSKLDGYDAYIYHSPNFMLPPFAGRKISTFHDLSVFRFPECHRIAQVRLMEKEIYKALEQADRLIAISEFTKNEIVQLFGYPDDKVAVVPNGVSPDFFPRSAKELHAPLKVIGLQPGRYFLSVATIEPRKNIDAILDAYEMLPKRMRMEYPLVICGGAGWKSRGTLERIKNMMEKGNVRYLGYVKEEMKPLLYAGATAVVFVPFYEGFGLPVLEAMASGAPIVASDISPLNEVSAGSSYRVLPQDTEELARLMGQMTASDARRNQKTALGLSVAREFSWKNTVEKTVLQYRELAGGQ